MINLNKPLDMKLVLSVEFHIRNPCGFEEDGNNYNIREFWLREARKTIFPQLTNPFARDYLERLIEEYS